MAMRGPRLEFAVGAFLLLTLASLLVLAVASTNQRWGFGSSQYTLTARFSQIGQLRAQAPVKIGGVTIGKVSDISLDPTKFDSVVTLSLDDKYKDLPADTSAGIFTSGLLGESYIGLQPGGDPDTLKPGEEIGFTQPAVDLLQLVGKYMFSGGGSGGSNAPAATDGQAPAPAQPAPPSTEPHQ
ncbi:Intermembrane phospholipid transport system binding protein MlaD [Xanthomonas hydrangeae]|uniref:outer membrane lipid asymmetry maintenance protein MlaD n=1 Tax=Xanthomonas hydrangeae TaxID=2775159 RepID=UPI0019631ECE|nr:Intermembrane phospholipid transport system binding protein MlaD [Xanthomonas hydrangeae]CAD7731007.1 Intermembrane phospholipid transport system binding protein MlaD [Xanthomonas hydrangeae]CAD7731290.1 Intermembrane phospholipid transport system binding protein MlaD [Xanthomonas hydrangeae]CAD7731294.1 Intermembrane phospholipid transport system binding protein MlaD [Xanthomonas hydrangeae]CAD7746009.1 Intermembrane phospholipid transport system binding protein MlaD [Xanthomonas hydrangeae